VPADQLRYDVGLIVDETENDILPSRLIDDGKYAIFEVPHTAQGVQDFWIQIPKLAENLSIDEKKPILERYTMNKIKNHLCEFCIPLK
ncbi:GyrI-like domain-containing protein, partial [Coprobacillus cateniformis]|nr:GyrI-like domain-containing protein [Coprobacillus cateniformis]